jgi:hypothetical protein
MLAGLVALQLALRLLRLLARVSRLLRGRLQLLLVGHFLRLHTARGL